MALLSKLQYCNLNLRVDEPDSQAYFIPRNLEEFLQTTGSSFEGDRFGEPFLPVPAEYAADVQNLAKAILKIAHAADGVHKNEHTSGDDEQISQPVLRGPDKVAAAGGAIIRLVWANIGLRVVIERDTHDGQIWASCRRLSTNPVDLNKLGFMPQEINILRNWGKQGGLVGFVGQMDAGKTTSWASFLVDLMRCYGGGAYTVEKPIEIVFQGNVGQEGLAIQVEAYDDADMAKKIDRATFWAPRWIGIGETTSGLIAMKTLSAANLGHLVANTWHGNTFDGAIHNFIQRAADVLEYKNARKIFSKVITGIVIQEKVHGVMTPQFFDIAGAGNTSDIRKAIEEDNSDKLASYIKDQAKTREGWRLPARSAEPALRQARPAASPRTVAPLPAPPAH